MAENLELTGPEVFTQDKFFTAKGGRPNYYYYIYPKVTSDGYIFDSSPCGPEPIPARVASRDIPGFVRFDSGYGYASKAICETNGGNNYELWGFRMYSHNPVYDTVYEWQCTE